jgi:cell wall-associated NlpC family hydrolase
VVRTVADVSARLLAGVVAAVAAAGVTTAAGSALGAAGASHRSPVPDAGATAAGATDSPSPAATSDSSTASGPSAQPAPAVAGWARAGVVTIWVKPNRTRAVDRPVLVAKPDVTRWIDRQSLHQRLDLADRVETQALRGEPVVVLLKRADGWSKVRLPQQTGSRFRDGIVGWARSSQLSARRPPTTSTLRRAHLAHRTGSAVVHYARSFLGDRYLWAGLSQHGIDCSGLTYLVYRAAGVTLPRDAADQAAVGHAVSRRQLRRGDLVFFGPGDRTTIHHVGIYAGHGLVLHAPYTGARVELTPLSAWSRSDYWGARRIL